MKCDGKIPRCSTCTSVYNTECHYDLNSDHRRKGALKRDIETLRERNGALGVIVESIRASSDYEVMDIVQQIRTDDNLDSLADNLERNMNLSRTPNVERLERDLSIFIGEPSYDPTGEARPSGSTAGLGLIGMDDGSSSPETTFPSTSWTSVTQDQEYINHLLTLYFCWQHPFYTLLSQDGFLSDMEQGRRKYCSPLLVNAMLAAACCYSDREYGRTDHHDPATAGDHFFTEARRLLWESEGSSLTTIQALGLMGIREASCSRESSGFHYAGRAVRMAVELGLHLDHTGPESKDAFDVEVRKITFWGVFNLDK